jgi:capsular polysaccharide biosynthesis protein
MLRGLIPPRTNKVAATRALADRIGIENFDVRGDGVMPLLMSVEEKLGRLANAQMLIKKSADIENAKTQVAFSTPTHTGAPPSHRNGLPPGFREGNYRTFATQLEVLTLNDAYASHIRDAPVIVTNDRTTVVGDYSSKYARLIYFYENDFRKQLDNARAIDGRAMIISDDIWPTNFCHWIVDWLPRLAFLAERARRDDVYVITTPLIAQFQHDTLCMCGVSKDRIIGLPSYQSVRARELFVPSDLLKIFHPAHKASPWALQYLRDTLGAEAIREAATQPKIKLYLSRSDSSRRRIANEHAFFGWLEKRGYISLTASDMTVAQQIAIFARASHIVSAHGAGLANTVFSGPGTQIIELFAPDHGTPAFYLIAASLGNPYASYVTKNFVKGERWDDLVINIEDFDARCGDLL